MGVADRLLEHGHVLDQELIRLDGDLRLAREDLSFLDDLLRLDLHLELAGDGQPAAGLEPPITTSNTDSVSPLGPGRILAKAAEMGARKAKADMDTNDRASARIAMSFPDHFRRKSAMILDGLDGSFSREAGDGSGIGVSPEAIGDAEIMVPQGGGGVSSLGVSGGQEEFRGGLAEAIGL